MVVLLHAALFNLLALASGEHVTTNTYKNVISSGPKRRRRHVLLFTALFGFNATFETPKFAKKLVTEFIRLHPDLSDERSSAYAT